MRFRQSLFAIVFICFIMLNSVSAGNTEWSREEIEWIGDLIFKNECSGKNEYLVSWNKGEEFMSLGIGHFIWYPDGKRGYFEEGFPLLIEYLKKEEVVIPEWLLKETACPWQTRELFMENKASKKVKELEALLGSTKAEQAKFIVMRLNNALPELLKATQEKEHKKVVSIFEKMRETPQGAYVLIDYINFKGLGTSLEERYQGQGCGLLQVINNMEYSGEEEYILDAFVASAERTLRDRVQNAPVERGEERWLKGWINRIKGYLLVEVTPF